jgi:hypothetical protein
MKATIESRNSWRRKIINGLGAFVLLLVGASGAEAQDAKTFPGTMCRQVGTASNVSYTTTGRVLNPSTTSQVQVICPIVRDHLAHRWQSLEIAVLDRNATPTASGAITCTAVSADRSGTSVSSLTSATSSGFTTPSGVCQDVIRFGLPAPAVNDGIYYVQCTLPASTTDGSSGICSYRIDENT